MKIDRTRYCIVRNNRTEIHCGEHHSFCFKPIEKVGNARIKTYRGKGSARIGLENMSFGSLETAEIVPCREIVEIED